LRYQAKQRIRHTLVWVIILLAIAAVAVGIFVRVLRPAPVFSAAITQLDASSVENITPFETGVFAVNEDQLTCYDPTGKNLWVTKLPQRNMAVGGDEKRACAWQGSQVVLVNSQGLISLDQSVHGADIRLVSVGADMFAALTVEDDQFRVRVYNQNGRELDSLLFPDQSVLDMGFFGDNNSQLWVLVLDTHATLPISRLQMYNPGKSITGRITLNGQVAYRVIPTAKSIYTVSTRYINNWSNTNDMLSEQMIYGWSVIDVLKDKAGGIAFCMGSTEISGGGHSLPMVWYCHIDAGGRTTQYRRVSMPVGCEDAVITSSHIVAATGDGLYTMNLDGSNCRLYQPRPDVRMVGHIPGQSVILQSGQEFFLQSME